MTLTPDTSAQSELTKPDFSLARKIEGADNKHFITPHLEHFTKGNKHLYYVGTKHGVDFENRTHEVIIQATTKHAPQLIIVEGIATDKGMSPSLGFDPKKPSDRERFMRHSGESVHTAEMARAKHIPFIGGEASTKSIFEALEKKGYSSKEVMALYLVRTIPIWERNGQLKNKDDFPKMASDYLANNSQFSDIPKEQRLTFDEFKAIYDAHKAEMGKEMTALTASDSNPHSAKANYFQKMSAVMDEVRDRHLIELISASLEKTDKVMVVYGNAHQYASAPVFEKMFDGKAHVEQLLLDEGKPAIKTTPAPTTLPPVEAKPSGMASMLKYGSFALLGAGVATLAVGTLPIATLGLLAGSAVAYTGSRMAETRPAARIPMPASEPAKKAEAAEPAIQPAPEQAKARSDGKSWVASAQSTGEHVARSV
jgi:hypothetical protein